MANMSNSAPTCVEYTPNETAPIKVENCCSASLNANDVDEYADIRKWLQNSVNRRIRRRRRRRKRDMRIGKPPRLDLTKDEDDLTKKDEPPPWKKMLIAMKTHMQLQMKKTCGTCRLFPCCCPPDKDTLLIIGGQFTRKEVHLLDLRTKTSMKILDLPFEFDRSCCARAKNKTFILGGGWPGTNIAYVITHTMEKDWLCRVTETFTCEAIQFMIEPRHDAGATVLNECLYVCGGSIGNESLQTCEFYSMKKKVWARVPSMENGRTRPAVVSCRGFVFCLGGKKSRFELNTVIRFHPIKQTWKTMCPMNMRRADLAAVVVGKEIYAVGGHLGRRLRTVEKFVDCKRWVFVKPMNKGRHGHSACFANGQIIVVGGDGRCGTMRTVEFYNIAADTWTLFCRTDHDFWKHAIFPISRPHAVIQGEEPPDIGEEPPPDEEPEDEKGDGDEAMTV